MTLRKAQFINSTSCKIRLKDGSHKIVSMLPLKERHIQKLDNDGDYYTITCQDYIIIDNNEVIGFLLDPSKDVMNDVYPTYPFAN